MDDASSVFDASILTGPVANYPGRRQLQPAARARLLDRRHPARVRGVGGVGPAVGERSRASSRAACSARWPATGRWRPIVTLQSGMPVAVTQTTNFNAFAGFGTQRPNLVGDPELPADERSPARWFNTAAFAIAPQFTLGSAPRGIPVRGPSYRNVDLALSRRVPLRAGRRRSSCAPRSFNLLNTPPLGNPNGVAGSAAFGTITTAGDPRVVQLAVKFLF